MAIAAAANRRDDGDLIVLTQGVVLPDVFEIDAHHGGRQVAQLRVARMQLPSKGCNRGAFG